MIGELDGQSIAVKGDNIFAIAVSNFLSETYGYSFSPRDNYRKLSEKDFQSCKFRVIDFPEILGLIKPEKARMEMIAKEKMLKEAEALALTLSIEWKIEELNKLWRKGLITDSERDKIKGEILSKFFL